ncbi:MAG: GNAT family N-acetyltransferase [Aquitalea sp.]|nr:GNAT family N-acetyltransferase [Aquitalea sp.]
MEYCQLTPDLLPACHALFADSIAALPDDDYPLTARLAWAGVWDEDVRHSWEARLAAAWSVAAMQEGTLLGFAWLSRDGEFDMLYVAPLAQGQGLAQAMMQQLEAQAAAAGVTALHAWASHAARPVFEKQGYRMLRPNRVSRDGCSLDNWLMAKGGWQEPLAGRSES